MSSARRHADSELGRSRRDRAPLRKHRRCDRRRRGASRLRHRLPPRQVRTRRPPAGEDRVPAREGLRRRPHPARHQAARGHGHRHLRGGRLAAQQGPADHRRRCTPPVGLARPRLLPRLRARPQARRLRRAARAQRPEGRRPALRALQRRRPDPRRAHRPDHRRPRQARRGETRSHLPRAPGGRRRRQLHPPLPRDGPAPPRGPPDGRGRTDVLHLATPRGRLPGVLAGAVGPPRRRGPPAARLRLDLRHGRRHLERRPRRPQHLRLLQGAGLARGAEGVVRVHAGGLGYTPKT